MREQQAQLLSAVGQRVLESLSTHSEEHPSAVHRVGRRPDPFKGTKADKDTYVVKRWLERMASYWQTAGIHKDPDKINLIRSFLVSDAGDEYDTRVSELGPFTSYKELEKWLTSHYATPDAINTYRDRFFGCQQQEGESVDDYFKRFREARNTLDTPLAETYVVYFLIRHLLPRYRTEIRKDKTFATYKTVTLDDVNDQLKRVNPTFCHVHILRVTQTQ